MPIDEKQLLIMEALACLMARAGYQPEDNETLRNLEQEISGMKHIKERELEYLLHMNDVINKSKLKS
jgi:hypothetical protein